MIERALQAARCAVRMKRHGIRVGLTICVATPPATYGTGEVKLRSAAMSRVGRSWSEPRGTRPDHRTRIVAVVEG